MGKKKAIIMRPTHRCGAWLYGIDQKGFSRHVPVGLKPENRNDLEPGFYEYRYR